MVDRVLMRRKGDQGAGMTAVATLLPSPVVGAGAGPTNEGPDV